MGNTLYTATGCSRCKIAKNFMNEHKIPFQEVDIKFEGKDAFGQFYRNNRTAIFRGKEGIEFPIFTDEITIRQGVGVVLSYLHAGTKLDGFIGRGELSLGWLDGIHVSEGDFLLVDDLITVLSYIRKGGLKLQLNTDGRNASVLEKLLKHKLGDRVVMEVKAPLNLYAAALNKEIDPQEIKRTIRLVAKFPEYRFQTTVAPVVLQEEGMKTIRYLMPEEIEKTARLIQEETGSNKQPYLLRLFDPEQCLDDRLRLVEKMPSNALFAYRSAARRHQVSTDIEKS